MALLICVEILRHTFHTGNIIVLNYRFTTVIAKDLVFRAHSINCVAVLIMKFMRVFIENVSAVII